jgi:hypothetical protein
MLEKCQFSCKLKKQVRARKRMLKKDKCHRIMGKGARKEEHGGKNG